MYKFLKLIKVIVFILLTVSIAYIIYNNKSISQSLGISNGIILIFIIIYIIFVAYNYIILYISKDRIEHEFTSIVNHTFRTPLTSIMWYSEELKKDLTINEKLLFLQNINNATNKVISIIDILVGIDKINDKSGFVLKATSLRDITDKSMEKHREEIYKKNIKFQVSSFKDIPLLTIDLNKISFVIDCLIENAIYYTPSEGKILIDSIKNKNGILFYISDTGIGLSFIDRMRIFSKFYRGNRAKLINTEGLGLRLYLSRKIIAKHNGNIYAKSKGKNNGTTFFVELPLKRIKYD